MPRISIALIIFLLASCTSKSSNNQQESNYIYIDGRDTTRIRITLYPDKFHGEMTNTRPGGYIVTGEISGNVKGDTLIGDYHYTPYKWRDKKRVPFTLLAKGDTYIEGTGRELIYMGIPYYIEETISFDKPKRIFKAIKK